MPAGHLCCQPVASVARHVEPSAGHRLTGVTANAPCGANRPGSHACGHMVHSAEITAALDHAIASITAHAQHIAQHTRPLIDTDR